MNNLVFERVMKNVRKHRGSKLVTAEKRRNYFVSDPKFFQRKFVGN